MKISINGDIISNNDKWVYDWLEYDATCPKDIHSAIERANGETLEVYINSGGGDVFSGNEIYETLRTYPGEVHIHIINAASAASVIACARKSDIAPTGMLMVHNVSSTAQGDYHDMDKSSEILQKANRALAAAYSAKSGKSETEILAMMDRETWLTGQEAVEAGLVDAISAPARLTAAGPGTLPPEVIAKVKATVRNPFARHDRSAQAKLDFLKLKGAAL